MYSLPGAVTDDSAVVLVRTDAEASVVVEYGTDPTFSSVTATGAQGTTTGGGLATKFALSSLTPNAQHYYRVKVDGVVQAATGAFRTAPIPGTPHSFTFAASGDADTGSTHAAFAQVKATNPAFFLHVGDLHYENIGTDDLPAFRDAYADSLGVPQQNALYRSCGFVYTWDDHDFGANNSDGSSASRPAARAAYREQVPHYPVPTGPIYHAFTWGRVRFVALDMRSERDHGASPPTTLGSTQLAWLKDEITAASESDRIVCIVSPVPYIIEATPGPGEGWYAFGEEREDLANHLQAAGMNRRTFILSSDWHVLAIDDGSGTRWATDPLPTLGPPNFSTGPLDRSEFNNLAAWSHGYRGPSNGQGHYATLQITDEGGPSIEVKYRGYYVAANGSASTLWHSFTCTLYTEEPPETEPEEGMNIQFVDVVSGDVAVTATSSASPTTLHDGLSVPAAVGDVLEVSLGFTAAASSRFLRLNAVTVDDLGAHVNMVGPGTLGVRAWAPTASASVGGEGGGDQHYIVQSGDIRGDGTVKVRLIGWLDAAGSRTVHANASVPLHFAVENRG